MGFTAAGLPLSLQMVGRPFDEATVLRAAHAYEMATNWRNRRPSLDATATFFNGTAAGRPARPPVETPLRAIWWRRRAAVPSCALTPPNST